MVRQRVESNSWIGSRESAGVDWRRRIRWNFGDGIFCSGSGGFNVGSGFNGIIGRGGFFSGPLHFLVAVLAAVDLGCQ